MSKRQKWPIALIMSKMTISPDRQMVTMPNGYTGTKTAGPSVAHGWHVHELKKSSF